MDVRLYQEELMEHFRNPRNAGEIAHPHFVAEDDNPTCGDRVRLTGKVAQGILTDMRFSGKGCVISQATTSMLTELCIGKSVNDLKQISSEDILELIGLPLGPNRLKCALLCRDVLRAGLRKLDNN